MRIRHALWVAVLLAAGVGSLVSASAGPELELASVRPDVPSELVRHTGYVTNYNPEWMQPNWVAYELTDREAESYAASRETYSFVADPDVSRSPKRGDYAHSGYSQGHMVPAQDMRWSEEAMRDSHYFSNCCPQAAKLNNGRWKRVEEKMHALAMQWGRLYVCCGPIVKPGHASIGPEERRIAVPDSFFKVVCGKKNGEWRAIGFVMPNRDCPGGMFQYAVPVDEVERLTGYDFFRNLPDDTERAVEASWREADWQ